MRFILAAAVSLLSCSPGSEPNPAAPRAAAPAGPVMLFLGDSLTAGYGVALEDAFPALLDERWRKEGLPWRARNAGASGATTAGVRENMDWTLAGDVKTLLLCIGANDGLRGLDLGATRKNLDAIVENAKGKGIRDLKGLEKCTNLHLINFAKNEVSDLTPLKDLKLLQSLDLSHNKITDAEPLAGLVGLQFLELSDNQITKVEPLGKLTKLSALYMANNKVADITPLGELTRLSSLDLAKNEVSNIVPVAKLGGLSTLKLSDNKIEDISPIPKKNQLKMLFLERNKVADLSPLVTAATEDAAGEKRFAPFLRLYVDGNPLSDAAKNQQLTALKAAGVRLESAEPKKP